jgi:tRNA-dihydrouridine synthase
MKFNWQKLPRPFLCLAPMEGVTDSVYRQVVVKAGKPDVMFTEFTSVDGLVSRGYEYVADRLVYTQAERPLIAQIWGTEPKHFFDGAKLLVDKGFDGIDINMGCPVKDVLKKGGGAGLIEQPELAEKLIKATVDGAGDLPVSVKTRIGVKTIVTDKWIPFLLKQPIKALTVHGRTAKEMSKVPVHWEEIGKAVEWRNRFADAFLASRLGTPAPNASQKRSGCNDFPVIIGNGDVVSRQEATIKAEKYGLDGIMIGRGAMKNSWIFQKNEERGTKQEKLQLLRYHVEVFEQTWGSTKPFRVLRKYFKIYAKGFPGAAELREKLMRVESGAEVEKIMVEFQI